MAIFGFGLIEKSRKAAEIPVPPEPVASPSVEEPKVEAPPAPRPEARHPSDAMSDQDMTEYRAVADAIGFLPPEVAVEAFRAFLVKHDLPVFDLSSVKSYMDDKSKRENPTGLGWEWRPLREKDRRPLMFGALGSRHWIRKGDGGEEAVVSPGSDVYPGQSLTFSGNLQPPSSGPYGRAVPLHALKKVSLIEREFRGDVAFFVSDYATKPHVNPDPFLMAVVPNPRVNEGVGRFVIDIWDEPSFGIERMVK